MFEIELKAHVKDRTAVISSLNKFATYLGRTFKDDTYYKLDSKNISCRFRKNRHTDTKGKTEETCYFTYKIKENLKAQDGLPPSEVNNELETEISSPEPVIRLLENTGYTVSLHKQKDVEEWIYNTAGIQIHIELCSVRPLGDFLEIEIVTEDASKQEEYRRLLNDVLHKTGLEEKDIETRYYSEMLKNTKKE